MPEQHGFRKIADATFMMTCMFLHGTNTDDVERYMRRLRQAQMDIDLEPERFQITIDARSFGVGERVVFLPYSQEMFETTQSWMHDRKLFDVGPEVGVSYNKAVRS